MSRKNFMEPIQEKNERKGIETDALLTESILKRLFTYLNVEELKAARLVCEHWKYAATPFLQEKAIVKLDGICPICKSEWKSRKKSIEPHNHYETIPFYRFVTQVQHMYPRDRDRIVFYRNFQIKNLNLYFIPRLNTEPTKYFLQFVKLMGSKVSELKLDSIQLCPTESIYQIMSSFNNLEAIHFSNVNVWLDPVGISSTSNSNNSTKTGVENNTKRVISYPENSYLKSITFSNGWNSDEFLNWDVIFKTCPELQELNLNELTPSEIKNCLSSLINLPDGIFDKMVRIRNLTINPRAKIEDQLLLLPAQLNRRTEIDLEVEEAEESPEIQGKDPHPNSGSGFGIETGHIDQFQHLNLAHLLVTAAGKLNSISTLSLRLPYTDEGNSFPQILEACSEHLTSVTLSRHPTIYAVQNDLVFKPNPFEIRNLGRQSDEREPEHFMTFPFVKKLEIAHNFIDNFDEVKQSFPSLKRLHLNIVPTEFVCPVGTITTYHTYLKTNVLLNMKNSSPIESISNLVWNIEEARASLSFKKKVLETNISSHSRLETIFTILDQDHNNGQDKNGDESPDDRSSKENDSNNEKRGIRTVVYKSNAVKHIGKVFPFLTKLSISITRGIDLHVIFRDLTQLHDLTLLGNSFYRIKDEDIIGWVEEDELERKAEQSEDAVLRKAERVPNGGIKQLIQLRRLSMENNNCCLTNESIKYGFIHLKRLRSLYISRGKKLTLRGLRILSRHRFLVYIKVTKLKQDRPDKKPGDKDKDTDEELADEIEAYELSLTKNPTLDNIPIRELREFPRHKYYDKYLRKPKTKIPALIHSGMKHQYRKYPSPLNSNPSSTSTVMINVSRKGRLPILVSGKQNTSTTLDYRKLHLTNEELVLPPLVPSQMLDSDSTLLPKDDLTINEIKEILDMSQDALFKYELEKRSKNRKVDKLFDQVTTKRRLKRFGKYEMGEKYHRIGGRRYFFIRTLYKVNGRTYELVRRKYENEGEKEKEASTKRAWEAKKQKLELKANKAKGQGSAKSKGKTSSASSVEDDDGSESEYERSLKDFDEEDDFEEYCDEDDENYLEFKNPTRGYDSEGAEDESSEDEGKCLEDDTMYEGDKEFYDENDDLDQNENDSSENESDDSDIGSNSGSGSNSNSDFDDQHYSHNNSEEIIEKNSFNENYNSKLKHNPDDTEADSDENYSSGHFSAEKDFISDSPNSAISTSRARNNYNPTILQMQSHSRPFDNYSERENIGRKNLSYNPHNIATTGRNYKYGNGAVESTSKIPALQKSKPSQKKTVVVTRRRIRFAERDLNKISDRDTILTERQNEEETITVKDSSSNSEQTKLKKKVSFKTKTKTSQNSTSYNNYNYNNHSTNTNTTVVKKTKSLHRQFSKENRNAIDIDRVPVDTENEMDPRINDVFGPASFTARTMDDKINEVGNEFHSEFENSPNSSLDLGDEACTVNNAGRGIGIGNIDTETNPFDHFKRDESFDYENEPAVNYDYNEIGNHNILDVDLDPTMHIEQEDGTQKKRRNSKKERPSTYVCENRSFDSESIIATNPENPYYQSHSEDQNLTEKYGENVDEMGAKLESMRQEMLGDIMENTSVKVSA